MPQVSNQDHLGTLQPPPPFPAPLAPPAAVPSEGQVGSLGAGGSATTSAPVGVDLPYRLGDTTFRLARDAETHDCLKLVLGTGGSLADEGRVVEFLRYAIARKLDLTKILVAERAGAVVWALLPVPAGGRAVLLLSPAHLPAGAEDAAAELIEAVMRGQTDIEIGQGLVDPTDPRAAEPFVRAGFEKLAVLQYFQRDVTSSPTEPRLPAGLEVATYSQATHPLFKVAIEDSYTQSLDCPSLNGRRQIDDVIDGHKAAGDFRPHLWRVVSRQHEGARQVVAVLLLNATGNGESMELVYLGVSPHFRGQGLGHWAIQTALWETYRAGLGKLTLAVDSLNRPALKLYFRFGLRRVHERLVLIRHANTPR